MQMGSQKLLLRAWNSKNITTIINSKLANYSNLTTVVFSVGHRVHLPSEDSFSNRTIPRYVISADGDIWTCLDYCNINSSANNYKPWTAKQFRKSFISASNWAMVRLIKTLLGYCCSSAQIFCSPQLFTYQFIYRE